MSRSIFTDRSRLAWFLRRGAKCVRVCVCVLQNEDWNNFLSTSVGTFWLLLTTWNGFKAIRTNMCLCQYDRSCKKELARESKRDLANMCNIPDADLSLNATLQSFMPALTMFLVIIHPYKDHVQWKSHFYHVNMYMWPFLYNDWNRLLTNYGFMAVFCNQPMKTSKK